MRNNSSLGPLTRAALLIILAVSVQAQERPFNFYATTPLNITSGYDSGIPDGNHRVDSLSTILTLPTFSITRFSPRNDFNLSYQGEFQMFEGNQRLDSWDHNAGLRWQYDLNARWSVSVNDTFSANHDYGERFESSFMLPRGPYRENGLYTSLNFDLTPETKLKFRYENAYVDFHSQDMTNPLFFSRMGNTFGVTADHHFTPKAKLSVSYSYL